MIIYDAFIDEGRILEARAMKQRLTHWHTTLKYMAEKEEGFTYVIISNRMRDGSIVTDEGIFHKGMLRYLRENTSQVVIFHKNRVKNNPLDLFDFTMTDINVVSHDYAIIRSKDMDTFLKRDIHFVRGNIFDSENLDKTITYFTENKNVFDGFFKSFESKEVLLVGEKPTKVIEKKQSFLGKLYKAISLNNLITKRGK